VLSYFASYYLTFDLQIAINGSSRSERDSVGPLLGITRHRLSMKGTSATTSVAPLRLVFRSNRLFFPYLCLTYSFLCSPVAGPRLDTLSY
jgi:hypothetical protein